MARFTLSIADDVAAQLDAYAAANNLNRSQAAENIFRKAFLALAPIDQVATGSEEDEEPPREPQLVYVGGDLAQQLGELRDYLTVLYSRHESLRNYVLATVDHTEAPFGTSYPKGLPEPGWIQRVQEA